MDWPKCLDHPPKGIPPVSGPIQRRTSSSSSSKKKFSQLADLITEAEKTKLDNMQKDDVAGFMDKLEKQVSIRMASIHYLKNRFGIKDVPASSKDKTVKDNFVVSVSFNKTTRDIDLNYGMNVKKIKETMCRQLEKDVKACLIHRVCLEGRRAY